MYITLVDYFDRNGQTVIYSELFAAIRESIDRAHRDAVDKTREESQHQRRQTGHHRHGAA